MCQRDDEGNEAKRAMTRSAEGRQGTQIWHAGASAREAKEEAESPEMQTALVLADYTRSHQGQSHTALHSALRTFSALVMTVVGLAPFLSHAVDFHSTFSVLGASYSDCCAHLI